MEVPRGKRSLVLPNVSTQNKATGRKQFGVGVSTEKRVTEQTRTLGAEFNTLQVHGERVEGLIGFIDNTFYTNDSVSGRKGWEDALKKVKKTSRNKYFPKECFNKKKSLELRGRTSKIPDAVEGSRKKPPFWWWQQLKLNVSTVFLHRKIPVFVLLSRQTPGR